MQKRFIIHVDIIFVAPKFSVLKCDISLITYFFPTDPTVKIAVSKNVSTY